MLGEKLGSMQLTTRNKVLPANGALPSFETTCEGSGTLAGTGQCSKRLKVMKSPCWHRCSTISSALKK